MEQNQTGSLREPGSGDLYDNETLTFNEDGTEAVYRVHTEEKQYQLRMSWNPDNDKPARSELLDIMRRSVKVAPEYSDKRYRLPGDLGDVRVHKIHDDAFDEFLVQVGRFKLKFPLDGTVLNRIRNVEFVTVAKSEAVTTSEKFVHRILIGAGGKSAWFLSHTRNRNKVD